MLENLKFIKVKGNFWCEYYNIESVEIYDVVE